MRFPSLPLILLCYFFLVKPPFLVLKYRHIYFLLNGLDIIFSSQRIANFARQWIVERRRKTLRLLDFRPPIFFDGRLPMEVKTANLAPIFTSLT